MYVCMYVCMYVSDWLQLQSSLGNSVNVSHGIVNQNYVVRSFRRYVLFILPLAVPWTPWLSATVRCAYVLSIKVCLKEVQQSKILQSLGRLH